MTANRLPERLSNGQLPSFAWPGGYPLFYLDGENSILCAKCATASLDNEEERRRPVACDAHYEGEPLQCDECYENIESAYGNPDEE